MRSGQDTRRNLSLGIVLMTVWVMTASVAQAQQINGVPGSPSATVTLDGKQLPPPPMPFGGVIKESAWIPSRTGRRAWCRPRAHPTSCSS